MHIFQTSTYITFKRQHFNNNLKIWVVHHVADTALPQSFKKKAEALLKIPLFNLSPHHTTGLCSLPVLPCHCSLFLTVDPLLTVFHLVSLLQDFGLTFIVIFLNNGLVQILWLYIQVILKHPLLLLTHFPTFPVLHVTLPNFNHVLPSPHYY